ncbi:MAG: hypothetical protein H6867_05750 [Rhodospirillales bacterium]|nr:hypothetical protein [Rhodospirillales bacterium]MCB9995031.1 hypothetical protein [Rhodospirillales bacterium]
MPETCLICQKLAHAHTATRKHIDDLKEEAQSSDNPGKLDLADKYDRLDELWAQIVAYLKQPGVSTDMMEQINDAVDCIPKCIKLYYDTLVKMDTELLELIKEINDEEYQALYHKSRKIAETIQKGRNLLSDLPRSEYDLQKALPAPPMDEKATKKLAKPKSGMTGKEAGVMVLPNGKKVRVLE